MLAAALVVGVASQCAEVLKDTNYGGGAQRSAGELSMADCCKNCSGSVDCLIWVWINNENQSLCHIHTNYTHGSPDPSRPGSGFRYFVNACAGRKNPPKPTPANPTPAPVPTRPPTPAPPPTPWTGKHFIMLLSDDTGYANLGFNDATGKIKTPALDALLLEGAKLDRHYVYRFCSPTRSSLLTGRYPLHVNQENNAKPGWNLPAMHINMTTLPEKLRTVGFRTHQVGKWHLGNASPKFLPTGRGFDTSLGYLGGSEDHFTQRIGPGVDLWASSAPAYGQNGTYSAFIYTKHSLQIIEEHAAKYPDHGLFMYIALAVTHEPEQAPDRFIALYPREWVQGRRQYNAMASAMDESARNITSALKRTGLWAKTLFVYSSDNGGPSLVGGPSFANNFPLRGGKGNDFEGGTRVAALVAGGLLPTKMHGTTIDGFVHIADWLATFCELAACNPEDAKADAVNVEGGVDKALGNNGLIPPVDSLSMWPMLSGANDTSPRTEIPLCFTKRAQERSGALIVGDYKLVFGDQSKTGFWWGPEYPNSTIKLNATAPGCPHLSNKSGCLYNIREDPTEHVDLAQKLSAKLQELVARMEEISRTVFQSDALGADEDAPMQRAVKEKYSGFVGPWLP